MRLGFSLFTASKLGLFTYSVVTIKKPMFLVHIFLCIKLRFFFFLHAIVFFCASKRRKKNQISYQAAFYVSMFYDGKSWKRQIFSIFYKFIYPKYSKHLPYTVAHTIDCACIKMLNHGLNHGLFLSLFKLIPCHIH